MAQKLKSPFNFKFKSIFEKTITVLNSQPKEAEFSAQGEKCNAYNLKHGPDHVVVEIQNDPNFHFLSLHIQNPSLNDVIPKTIDALEI